MPNPGPKSHLGTVIDSPKSHFGTVIDSLESHLGTVMDSLESHVGTVIDSRSLDSLLPCLNFAPLEEKQTFEKPEATQP